MNRPVTVLVVDDEPQIRRVLRTTLTGQGYEVHDAKTGEDALEAVRLQRFDLVLLDMNMPGMGGTETCREIRESSEVAIIMLTVRNTEQDKVAALDAGADDYVTKPFSMRELIARVRALLRRQAMLAQTSARLVFSDDHLALDLDRPCVEVEGKSVTLSARELALLRALVVHRGRVRTRRQLLEEAWGGDEYIDPRTVDVHIRWLRKKLEPDSERPRYIETIRGLGYRFRA